MDERSRLLIIDDSKDSIRILIEMLKRDFRINASTDGITALKLAEKWKPDVIILDVVMPGINGYDICMRLKASEKTRDIPIIFATAVSSPEEELACIKLGALDYVTKPIVPKILSAKIKNYTEIKNERTVLYKLLDSKRNEIDCFVDGMLVAGAGTNFEDRAKRRLVYTRVFVKSLISKARYSELLVSDLAKAVCAASPYHDIGETALPEEICKSDVLTADEFEMMKSHVAIREGLRNAVLEAVGNEFYANTAFDMIRYHHERWDGAGYPDGLKGEETPLCARIMSIIDQYDTLTHRPAGSGKAYHFEAVRSISAESGKSFDPCLVLEFLSIQDAFLNAGEQINEEAQ